MCRRPQPRPEPEGGGIERTRSEQRVLPREQRESLAQADPGHQPRDPRHLAGEQHGRRAEGGSTEGREQPERRFERAPAAAFTACRAVPSAAASRADAPPARDTARDMATSSGRGRPGVTGQNVPTGRCSPPQAPGTRPRPRWVHVHDHNTPDLVRSDQPDRRGPDQRGPDQRGAPLPGRRARRRPRLPRGHGVHGRVLRDQPPRAGRLAAGSGAGLPRRRPDGRRRHLARGAAVAVPAALPRRSRSVVAPGGGRSRRLSPPSSPAPAPP